MFLKPWWCCLLPIDISNAVVHSDWNGSKNRERTFWCVIKVQMISLFCLCTFSPYCFQKPTGIFGTTENNFLPKIILYGGTMAQEMTWTSIWNSFRSWNICTGIASELVWEVSRQMFFLGKWSDFLLNRVRGSVNIGCKILIPSVARATQGSCAYFINFCDAEWGEIWMRVNPESIWKPTALNFATERLNDDVKYF